MFELDGQKRGYVDNALREEAQRHQQVSMTLLSHHQTRFGPLSCIQGDLRVCSKPDAWNHLHQPCLAG